MKYRALIFPPAVKLPLPSSINGYKTTPLYTWDVDLRKISVRKTI